MAQSTSVAPGATAAEAGALADGAAFVDGEFVPIADARIPILDWGFLRSDATYDVAHVWRGSFFRLDDHLDRFERGMERLHMALPYDRAAIRATLLECVHLSGLREAYVEMVCTRGVPPAGSRDPRTAENRFYAFAVPFVWIQGSPPHGDRGLHAVIGSGRRIAPDAVDPTVKNYHWLDFQVGLFEAYERGGETVVLTDAGGNVAEGPGFNVFVVADGRLATPAHGALEGISRRTVIEIAAELGVDIEVRAVGADELRGADEAFLSSTAGGVIPVTRVDGLELGDAKPGPVTRRVQDTYWAWHEDARHSQPVSY